MARRGGPAAPVPARRRQARRCRPAPPSRPRPTTDERRRRQPAPTRVLPSTAMGRLAWHHADLRRLARRSPTATSSTRAPLTNDRPYFAAYVKPHDLPQDPRPARARAGRVGLSAALGDARHRRAIAAVLLVPFPVVFGWRTVFSASRPARPARSSISPASASATSWSRSG